MSSVQGSNVVVDLSHFNQVTSFQDVQTEWHRRGDTQGHRRHRLVGPNLRPP